jgi:O-antigen/teichoic acid export membrane protein
MQLHWRLAKNAIVNVGRGGAAAIFAVLLPPVLVRHMTPASYAVWVLVLQTAAYVSYLNFGLQTAIGRYVAYAVEKKDHAQRDSVFSTAFAGLCAAALVSLVCLVVAIIAAPALFPSVPEYLMPQMRLALLIVGIAMAAELPASAWTGVFIGMERYEIPALTVGGARFVSACGVVAAALAGRSLVFMAVIIASANILSYFGQYLSLRRFAPDVHFNASLVLLSTARELYGYCFGLTILSFSMLLVTGFDLLFVGHFQFAAVTPYSVAASMISVISGLLYAVVGVIMPHAAVLHARRKAEEMGSLVISSTRFSVVLLIMTGVPILISARQIVGLWIGQRYVAGGASLLEVLIVANIIRLIGAPYGLVLIASGQQRYIKVSPLAEGISNVIASVALGAVLGGLGVALGTLFGSIVGLVSHLFYSMVHTKSAITFSRKDFVTSGVLAPLLCTSPLLGLGAASLCGIEIRLPLFSLAMLLSLVGAGLLLLRTHGFVRKRFDAESAQEGIC